jgi:hypothetical protein
LIDGEAAGCRRERTRRCRANINWQTAQERQNAIDAQVACGEALASQSGRISQGIAREVAHYAFSRLEHYDTNIQHQTVQKFLSHNIMTGMIPPFLENLESVKLQSNIISSMREGLKDHLVGVKQSKLVMAKDILCTLASSGEVGSGRGVVGLLGVDRRNIGQARTMRLTVDAGHDAFWLHHQRKIHSDAISESARAAVE